MIKEKPQGFVLILSVLTLSTLLMVGSYVLSTANSENNISNAQAIATKNYYLAEAGISEMIWKIQNDASTKNAFLNGTLSSSNDITKSDVFGDTNADYAVAARNTVAGEAWITATSTYQIGGHNSRRVIKTYVTKPTGSTNAWEFATFAGGQGSQQNGNFRFTGSGTVFTANGGRIHANQEIKVQGAEVVVNDGVISSSNVINVVAGGTLTLNNSYQDVPTTTVDMLQIDFDSADSNSWKNRATSILSKNAFSNLPNNTTLTGIIYVTGDAKITGKNMTINGVLIAEGEIEATLSGNTFTVNAHETYGGGLLSKGDVEFYTSGGTVSIEGLIYASDDLEVVSSGTTFTVDGSMTGFDARVTASGGSVVVNYVPDNYTAVIDPIINPDSPIIQIDHWEEQY